jgi:hypothetical protein
VAEDADQPMRARKRSSDRIAMAFMRRMDTIFGELVPGWRGMKRGRLRAEYGGAHGDVLWKRPPRPNVGIRPMVCTG